MTEKESRNMEDLKEEIPDVSVSSRTREVLERAREQPAAGNLAEILEEYL